MEGRTAACALRTLFLVGGIMSPMWFGLQFWMTSVHELDAVIINYAGKLRYHTQNIGIVYVIHNLERTNIDLRYHVHPGVDSFATIESVIGSLLGKEPFEDVPEALDSEVKESLRELSATIAKIKSMQHLVPWMNRPELKKAILDINAATLSIDEIVHAASRGANNRVYTLLLLNITRAVVQFVWACVAVVVVGKIWSHYYQAHIKLDLAQKGQMALLSTMFDVVVRTKTKDGNVIEADSKLDHLVGKKMQGESILSCASDSNARAELQNLLQVTQLSMDSEASESCMSQWIRNSWWWNLVPSQSRGRSPVAPMIRTTWWHSSGEGTKEEMHLEVIAAPCDCVTANSGTLLLGVRVAGTDSEFRSESPSQGIQDIIETRSIRQNYMLPAVSEENNDVAIDVGLAQPILGAAPSVGGNSLISLNLHTERSSARSIGTGRSSSTAVDGGMSLYSGSEATPPPTLYGNRMANATTDSFAAIAAARSHHELADQLSDRLHILERL